MAPQWKSITISISIVIVLCLIGFINRKREKIEIPRSGKLVLLIFITEVLLVLGVSFASFSLNMVSSLKVKRIGKSFWCVGGIVLAFIVYELANYFSKYQREQSERYIQEQINDKQREYFEQLLKREEKTRKFRHDISAQLAAIKSYLSSKEYDKAESFLSEVSDELIRVTEKRYQVGNEIVDVMLNHYLNPDLCRISVKGYLGNVSIKDRDLCVIVSNLLSNAVDEINRHEYEDPFIRVNVKRGDIFAAIIVENTCCKKMKLREGKLPVSEKNSDEHGHGISNVINLIEKYGGDYSFEADGEVFRAEVVLRYGDGK
ncbi:MAG: GHKL domain-containing protein [Butyrivibrio sp.]|nr:GHKL domain-containing protein [Butyrivibrio sp.]